LDNFSEPTIENGKRESLLDNFSVSEISNVPNNKHFYLFNYDLFTPNVRHKNTLEFLRERLDNIYNVLYNNKDKYIFIPEVIKNSFSKIKKILLIKNESQDVEKISVTVKLIKENNKKKYLSN